MSRFLIATTPVIGHVRPAIPMVHELVKRGHDVCWYTGQRFREKIEAIGAHFLPMQQAYDFDDRNMNAAFPGRSALKGLSQIKFDMKHVFADDAPKQGQDLHHILQDFPVDVFLSNSVFAGAAYIHQETDLPWAVYGTTPLTSQSVDTAPFGLALPPNDTTLGRLRNRLLNWFIREIVMRDVQRYAEALARKRNYQLDTFFLDRTITCCDLYLQPTVPEFEYPRRDLPPTVHFIGASVPPPDPLYEPPEWWDDLKSGRPVVHVTQGTIEMDFSRLLIPTLQGLAEEELLLVATTGNKPKESLALPSLPDNARLETFIPHAHLLPHTDVMITNGGYGGVQQALAHGVRLIGAGKTEDKAENCARIAWSGVGINLKTNSPTPTQIRQAVQKVLAEPTYQQNARRLQAAYQRYHPPNEAVDLLETLARTKQPLRHHSSLITHHSSVISDQ